MPKIITNVDSEIGNYEHVFIYTINASFNGVEGDIRSAKIQLFIPNYFTVYLGDIEKPIINVIEESTEEGTNYIFDLGEIIDLGITLRFALGVVFNTTAITGTSYQMISKMIINDEELLQYENKTITLSVTPRFVLSRERMLPQINPAPGGTVFYRVSLENYGDLGGSIENIEIICNGNEDLIIDENYKVVGRDVSTNFTDTSADDKEGIVNNNQILFKMDQYSGERYEFIYRCIVNENAYSGLEIDTIATWSIDGNLQKNDLDTLFLEEPTYDATVSVYGPDYTIPNEPILYEVNMKNSGNQTLKTVKATLNLSEKVIYETFYTGIFHLSELNEEINKTYTIDYTTVNGIQKPLGTFDASTNQLIDLSNLLGENDNLDSLTWNFDSLDVGVSNKVSPMLRGVVREDAIIGKPILSNLQFTWNTTGLLEERIANQSAVVEDICVLIPLLSQSTKQVPVKPEQTFTYTLGANCIRSRLSTPIFAILLPPQLEYVGEEEIIYTHSFENTLLPTVPPATVIPNFLSTGETLVTYQFRDAYAFDFLQKSLVSLNLKVKVSKGAKGNYIANTLLNTIESKSEIRDNIAIYEDKNNIAADQNVDNIYAKSPTVANRILFFISVNSSKKVKGTLNENYVEKPLNGDAIAGDTIDYKISINNIGNADLESIEIVDIFPYVGDTGVIETSVQRKSEFTIYNSSEIVAYIVDDRGEKVKDSDFEIYYSKSYDPVRFSDDLGSIGSDDDWTMQPPEDLTTVTAIKLKTINTKLLPNHILEVRVKGIVPLFTPIDSIAFNSFAADISFFDDENVLTHMLATEPEKVGVKVNETIPGTGSISGFVWLDENSNGIFDEKEGKLNDIGVLLYKKDGTPLKALFTTTTYNNQQGYYSFGNLPIDQYFIKFFIDDRNYKFTNAQVTNDLGSKVNPKTALTSLIDLNKQESVTTMHAGIVPVGSYSIETILAVNKSARSMLRSVIYDQMLIGMKLEDLPL